MGGGHSRSWVIAACGAVVSGGHDYGYAFCGSLLPERVVKSIACGTEGLFAGAVGVGKNRRDFIIDGIGGAQIDATGGIGAAGDDKIDGRAWSYSARPFHIEEGFFGVELIGYAGIRPAEEKVRIIRLEAEDLAERLHICEFDLRLRGDGNGYAGAVDAAVEQAVCVVNRGKISRRHIVGVGGSNRGEIRRQLCFDAIGGSSRRAIHFVDGRSPAKIIE